MNELLEHQPAILFSRREALAFCEANVSGAVTAGPGSDPAR